MQGKFDTAALSQIKVSDPVIRKGDLLNIIVYSDNPQATSLFNQVLINTASGSGAAANSGGSSTSAGGPAPVSSGYLVDERGNIAFQGIGFLHIEGLTRGQLIDTLNSRLGAFLQNPYYSIRFLNYRVTMLGEVARPGVYTLPGERVNILEAIGLAGDLTFYGRRDSVLVIRENNGKREFARLDLTKPEIMVSPYFYLQQNDMVIVEPNKKKVAASDQVTARNISIAATIVSTIAIVYSIFR
jgi:polysaccharide export outer membrane protein